MAEQRARAKADANAKKVGHGDLSAYRAALELGGSDFTGYREVDREALVTALVGEDGLLPAAREGDEVLVVLDATPFYAEGGGQLADWGRITVSGGDHTGELTVLDVQQPLPGYRAPRAGAQRRDPSRRCRAGRGRPQPAPVGFAQPFGDPPAAPGVAPQPW